MSVYEKLLVSFVLFVKSLVVFVKSLVVFVNSLVLFVKSLVVFVKLGLFIIMSSPLNDIKLAVHLDRPDGSIALIALKIRWLKILFTLLIIEFVVVLVVNDDEFCLLRSSF